MSLIPNKEFEFDGDVIIEEMRLFDSVKFPDVLLIRKRLQAQRTSKYYLFDTIKNKDIYVFPRDDYPLSGTFQGLNNKMIYDSINQILTYMTIHTDSPGQGQNRVCLEKIKLSYENFNFKTETLNNLEIPYINNSYGIKQLQGSEYMVLFCNVPSKLIIFDFKTLEIVREYSNKYLPYNDIIINNILLIADKNELIIYDYINHRELQTIVNRHTPDQRGYKSDILVEQKNEFYIIKDGQKTSFYKFINEEEIPDENKCVICFSRTQRKNVLVPCGHTQFCSKCVKENMETCPLCRANIEKVIKIY